MKLIKAGYYGQSQFRLFHVAIYAKEDNSVVISKICFGDNRKCS